MLEITFFLNIFFDTFGPTDSTLLDPYLEEETNPQINKNQIWHGDENLVLGAYHDINISVLVSLNGKPLWNIRLKI